jgi:hypothetical protein
MIAYSKDAGRKKGKSAGGEGLGPLRELLAARSPLGNRPNQRDQSSVPWLVRHGTFDENPSCHRRSRCSLRGVGVCTSSEYPPGRSNVAPGLVVQSACLRTGPLHRLARQPERQSGLPTWLFPVGLFRVERAEVPYF